MMKGTIGNQVEPPKENDVRKFPRIVLVAITFVLFELSATPFFYGQVGGTGRIVGVVQDPAGAVMAAVSVTATNIATNTKVSVTSDSVGAFIISNLPAGEYELQTTQKGFQAFREAVTVIVGRETSITVKLALSGTAQQINVGAVSTTVDTVSSSLQSTVGTTMVTELPLNGRDALQLLTLQPGAVGTSVVGSNQTQEPLILVNGARGNANNFTLDGSTMMAPLFNTGVLYPNPDALQEYTVTTTNTDVQYGRNDGATITAVTRSGGNHFHGAAWEFFRNTVLDSIPWGGTEASPFKRNQFGFAFGGPIVRDRTFFFVSYQGTRAQSSPGVNVARVPDALERSGNLSEYFPANTIIDPMTNLPYPNNTIPSTSISPITAGILAKEIPLPNSLVGGVPTFVSAPNLPDNDDQVVARFDHRISDAHKLMARLFRDNNPQDVLAGTIPLWSVWSIDFTNLSQTVQWGWILNPNSYNQLSFNYFRQVWNKQPHVPGTVSWASLGANIPPTQVGPTQTPLSVNGFFSIGAPEDTRSPSDTYEVEDVLTLTRGRHNIRVGGIVGRIQQVTNSLPLGDGDASFTGEFTTNAFADFLLGQPASFLQFASVLEHRWQPEVGAFIQDDMRVRSNLTLNVGLRYEPLIFPRETRGIAARFVPGQQSTVFPTAPKDWIFAGDSGFKNGRLANNQLSLFEPRIGVAWDPFRTGRTSIRAGFGIYHDQNQQQGFDYIQAPFSFPIVIPAPAGGIANPYGGMIPPLNLTNISEFSPASVRDTYPFQDYAPYTGFSFPNKSAYAPTSLQWNLSIQREVMKNTTAQVAYVGSHGYHQWNFEDINPPYYVPGVDSSGNPLSTSANINSRRFNYPGLAAVSEQAPVGENTYNGVQFSVTRQYTSDIVFQANYTISKNLGIGPVGNVANQTGDVLWFSSTFNHGLIQFDTPQSFAAAVTWNLPWYRQQQGIVGHLAGGWELSAIPSIHSGVPVTVAGPDDNSRTGLGLDRADLVPGQNPRAVPRAGINTLYLNPTAFQPNAIGTFGDSPIGVGRDPGYSNIDFGLFKNFRIAEAQQLQFRSEFFNAINHPNLGAIDANISDPLNFGYVRTKTGFRVIEFALKYSF